MFVLKVFALPLLLLCYWPGKVMLWIEYMYPSKGQVWASKRRYESPLVCVMASILLWAVCIMSIFIMATTQHNKAAQVIWYDLQKIDSHGYARQAIYNLDGLIKEYQR